MDVLREALDVVPGWFVLVVVGGLVLAESALVVGLVLPGTTAVLGLGVLGGLGVAPLPVCLAVSSVAAVAGTQLAYRSGRSEGTALRESRFGAWVGSERWAVADRLVVERGLVAVPAGQFVVVARTLVPRLVAQAGVPWARFSLVSVPSALVWALALTTAGFVAGANVDAVAAGLSRAGASAALVVVGVLALSATGRLVAGRPLATPTGARRPSGFLGIGRGRSTAVDYLLGGAVLLLACSVLAVVAGVVASLAVRVSGIPALDETVAAWRADAVGGALEQAALAVVSVARSSFVLLAAALLAVVVLVRADDERRGVVGPRVLVVGVALVVLFTATSLAAPRPSDPDVQSLYATQTAVVPAVLAAVAGVVAGTRARSLPAWAWAGLVVVAVVLAGARVLTGFSTLSATLVGLSLAAGWSVLLVAAVLPPTGRGTPTLQT